MTSKIQQVAISTTSGEVVGDHSYTEAVAELDNTKEHDAEMKGGGGDPERRQKRGRCTHR